MNKLDLIKLVASETGNPQQAVKEVVNSFLSNVKKSTLEEGKVSLSDFGTFRKNVSKERTGINPQTLESMQIASKTTIKFKASAN